MTVAFISDLHLSDHTPKLTELFCHFLDDCIKNASSLYILGDFFDIWVGDDAIDSTSSTLITALNHATKQGLAVFFMRGNRDFLIGKKFIKKTGCTLLPDEYTFNLAGHPTLLMHGDTLCTQDKAYLKFRRWSHCWLIKKIFLMKSVANRLKIAARYRTASQQHTAKTPINIMDVTPSEVVKVIRSHRVHILIHGHTHRPNKHAVQLENNIAYRYVLPAWHEEGGALLCSPSGEFKSATFQLNEYNSPFRKG